MHLQLTDISKTFQRGGDSIRPVVEASLTVAPGELVGLQGPSGSGKSTLLLIAGGLLSPDGGSVRWDETDPYGLSGDARTALRGQSIGFVFQQFYLIPYLSVRDNVLAAGVGLPIEQCRDTADRLIERFGLTERRLHHPARSARRTPARHSRGRCCGHLASSWPMSRRATWMRTTARSSCRRLREVTESGTAVLLVTHDDKAVQIADRVLRMRDGKPL
ncbi:MAG: ABC transporter ATP-binding protein [Planctomycetaceae bacterium]